MLWVTCLVLPSEAVGLNCCPEQSKSKNYQLISAFISDNRHLVIRALQAYGYICFISEYTIVMFDSKTREKRYVLKMSDVINKLSWKYSL